jgi:hypothetical protein
MARDITIRYVGDSSSAERAARRVASANDRMQGKFSRLTASFKRIGVAAGVGFAGAGVLAVKFGSDFVKAAEESQKVTAQTAAVIKSMGNVAGISAAGVAKLSEKLSLKTGIDDELIQSGANVLLTFRQVRDEVGRGNNVFTRATTVANDMSVALGKDLNSSVIQIGKALNDPIKGLTALGRAGVQFTKQQREQITALVEAGDVMGAQKIILAELERQFSGSAAAQATASDKLRVAWGNLQEKLGRVLLPLVEKFSDWMIQTGIPAMEAFAAAVERNWPEIQRTITNVVRAIQAYVIPVVQGLQALWHNFGDDVLKFMRRVWPAVKQVIVGALNAIQGFIKLVTAIIKGDWSAAWKAIQQIFSGIWNVIVGVLKAHLERVKILLRAALEVLKSLWRSAWNAIWKALQSVWRDISGFFSGLPSRFRNFFAGATGWLLTGGKNIMRGLFTGIKNIWNDIIGWFKDLPGKILRILHIRSPPDWAINAGRWIMRGITKGLGLGVGSVWDFMSGLSGRFTGALKDAWNGAFGAVSGFFTGGPSGTSARSNAMLGRQMAQSFGWTGSQWDALNSLVMSESGWSNTAQNPTSTAYGIGQFLDSTWATVGASKTSDPTAQIAAMLTYIRQRYGDPMSAWAFKQSHNWYGGGGVVPGPVGARKVIGAHGGEGIFTPRQMQHLSVNGGGRGATVNVIINHPVVANEAEFARMVARGISKAGDLGVPITVRGKRVA